MVLPCGLLWLGWCSGRGGGLGDRLWWVERSPLESRWTAFLKEARYVGREACRPCHAAIYDSFVQSEMGRSWRRVRPGVSAVKIDTPCVEDPVLGQEYCLFWRDTLLLVAVRWEGRVTRVETVRYFVGSGHHTQSHLWISGDYLFQVPITYYAQADTWGLPPGFLGTATGFDRAIGVECIACHSDYPEWVPGSFNKYRKIREGIGCERCHGPGSVHIAEARAGRLKRDSLTGMLTSIIHPGKLPPAYQLQICMRCHLQGISVVVKGKSFMDFHAGMWLPDVLNTYLPRFERDTFLMASHVERLMRSACFREGRITCITCHNPHKSIKEFTPEHYNRRCMGCHAGNRGCTLPVEERRHERGCIGCHMVRSAPVDIPHVWITDHWIRVPGRGGGGDRGRHEGEGVGGFRGLWTPFPDSVRWRLQAFLKLYERFWRREVALDSARALLKRYSSLDERIFYHFLREEWDSVIWWAPRIERVHSAWTAYRIGEAFFRRRRWEEARRWFARALSLAPYLVEVCMKYAVTLGVLGMGNLAEEEFRRILREHPRHWRTWYNLGVLYMRRGLEDWALDCFRRAHALNPAYEPARRMIQYLSRNQPG